MLEASTAKFPDIWFVLLTALVSLSGARTHPGRRRGLNGLIRVVLSNRRFYRVHSFHNMIKPQSPMIPWSCEEPAARFCGGSPPARAGFAAMRRRYSFTAFTLRDMRPASRGFDRSRYAIMRTHPYTAHLRQATRCRLIRPRRPTSRMPRQQASTEGVCLSDDAVSHSIFAEHRRPTYAQF